MAEAHPIENLMMTSMSSLESMVDVNTIVGDMLTAPDGTVIIPVSKVCFGFAAGGSEFNTNKLNKYSETAKLPFGGGSGAGVHITPMAFLVANGSNVKLLTLDGSTPVDKLIELIPDVINKATNLAEQAVNKPEKTVEIDIEKKEKSSDGN